jgi:hypothetical protein
LIIISQRWLIGKTIVDGLFYIPTAGHYSLIKINKNHIEKAGIKPRICFIST